MDNMHRWVKIGVLALMSAAFVAPTQAALPRHGYEHAGSGRSDSGLRWELGSRAGAAPCLRLSIATAPRGQSRPRAWDCFQDYFTAVAVYPDCARDEGYVYGPLPRRVTRVVVTYNYGRTRRAAVFAPADRPGRFYAVSVSRLRRLAHVRAYARGGRLVDDVRVGFSDVCG
jgi:hypothetical protein